MTALPIGIRETLTQFAYQLIPVLLVGFAIGMMRTVILALAETSWRLAMLDGRRVLTQDFACALIATAHAGLLIRCFAKGAVNTDVNLVFLGWENSGCSLEVINDEGRSDRM